MKKIFIIIALVLVAGTLGYFAVNIDKDSIVSGGLATYSSPELGLKFNYKAGPEGYVVEERFPTENFDNLQRVIILFQTKDKENIDKGNIPVGGEGPATITISVFKNVKKQFPLDWANKNIAYSNINLKMGDTKEYVLGGANAVRYLADGLYASDNVVVAHGENVYVFNGAYMDAESQLKKDFQPILDSVNFIQQPNQE